MGSIISLLRQDEDVVTTPLSKLVEEQINIRNALTPNERLYTVFSTDEYGHYSPEVNATMEIAGLSFFGGSIVGGFIQSKNAYLNWMETNRGTQFTDHFEAKKKLQDTVTKGMVRGMWMWGWRTAAFCCTYQLISTTTAVYRGKFGILEHALGGCAAGMLYKFNIGSRGVIVGAAVGGVLGTIAGTLSTGLCYLTGVEMDHLRYYQNCKKLRVEELELKQLKEIVINKDHTNYPLHQRDKKIGANLTLNSLDSAEDSKATSTENPK